MPRSQIMARHPLFSMRMWGQEGEKSITKGKEVGGQLWCWSREASFSSHEAKGNLPATRLMGQRMVLPVMDPSTCLQAACSVGHEVCPGPCYSHIERICIFLCEKAGNSSLNTLTVP